MSCYFWRGETKIQLRLTHCIWFTVSSFSSKENNNVLDFQKSPASLLNECPPLRTCVSPKCCLTYTPSSVFPVKLKDASKRSDLKVLASINHEGSCLPQTDSHHKKRNKTLKRVSGLPNSVVHPGLDEAAQCVSVPLK